MPDITGVGERLGDFTIEDLRAERLEPRQCCEFDDGLLERLAVNESSLRPGPGT